MCNTSGAAPRLTISAWTGMPVLDFFGGDDSNTADGRQGQVTAYIISHGSGGGLGLLLPTGLWRLGRGGCYQ